MNFKLSISSNLKIFFHFILLGIFLFTILFFSHQNKKMEVILVGKVFTMDVADTDITRERGLSGRAGLSDGQGMIFVFQKPDNYNFWMKDMLFPIDIIWIDQNFKIIHIEKSILPETYPKFFGADAPSLYVLEIGAGEALKLDLKAGDIIEFPQK